MPNLNKSNIRMNMEVAFPLLEKNTYLVGCISSHTINYKYVDVLFSAIRINNEDVPLKQPRIQRTLISSLIETELYEFSEDLIDHEKMMYAEAEKRGGVFA